MAEVVSKKMFNILTFDECITSETKSFDFRKKLFDFGLDPNWNLTENKMIPKLKEEYHRNRLLKIDLDEVVPDVVDNKSLITNYDNHRKQMWPQFLRCLQQRNIIYEEDPTFVTLSDVMSDLFVVEERDSKFFALKFDRVIYLFRNESLELEEGFKEEDTCPQHLIHARYLKQFSYLISDLYELETNGFQKVMAVDRIDLKSNKLIVCHGVAAHQRNGSSIYVKCGQINNKHSSGGVIVRQIYGKTNLKPEECRKLCRDWSNCVIDGSQTMIIGKRFKSILREVMVIEVDQIPKECRGYWSDSKCFSFVDQSLEFIKSSVDSELELYEFVINSKNKTISYYRRQSADTCDHFLPEFYTKS